MNDSDGDGVCDEIEVSGCTNAGACNYDSSATDDDSSCTFTTDVAENIDCDCTAYDMSLIKISRSQRYAVCRSRW